MYIHRERERAHIQISILITSGIKVTTLIKGNTNIKSKKMWKYQHELMIHFSFLKDSYSLAFPPETREEITNKQKCLFLVLKFIISKYHYFMKRKQGLLGGKVWFQIQEGMCKINLGHSSVPESKAVNHISLLKIGKAVLKACNNLSLHRC